jgi:hypothetical protein
MDGSRFAATVLATLALAVALTGAGQAQTTPSTIASAAPAKAEGGGAMTKVYSLAFADDPRLGPWIAETVPEFIEPASWKVNGAAGVIRYNASSQLLVINNSPVVLTQVEAFLGNVAQSVKKARLEAKGLTQVQHVTPNLQRVPETKSAERNTGYPVPAPVAAPKHLFHFVIRYEGNFDSSLLGLLGGPSIIVPGPDVTPSAVPIPATEAPAAPPGSDQPSTGAATVAKPSASPLVSAGFAAMPVAVAKPETPSVRQLFNFIFRYEGDGIVDANVVELFKAFKEAERHSADAPAAPKEVGPASVVPSTDPSQTPEDPIAPRRPPARTPISVPELLPAPVRVTPITYSQPSALPLLPTTPRNSSPLPATRD